MTDSDSCPWCNQEAESLSHALIECPMVADLWVECGCEALMNKEGFMDFKTSWKLGRGSLIALNRKGLR